MSRDLTEELFSGLTASPEMFPDEIDFESRVVRFCRMDRKCYRDSAFLDDRKIRLRDRDYPLGLDSVISRFSNSPEPPGALNWLFHTPHSGSTLLARAIDALRGGFVLQEPTVLIQTASLKRHDNFSAWKASGEWRIFFNVVESLLARTFVDSDTALVKTTSVCHILAEDAFGGRRKARGLFLYSGLEKFLVSLYKRDYLDAYLRAQYMAAVADLARLNFLDPGEAQSLPDNRKATVLWLAIVLGMETCMRSDTSGQLMVVDESDFLGSRKETLAAIAHQLNYSAEPELIENIVTGPIFSRDAKSRGEAFSAEAMAARNKVARDSYRSEIDDALDWAGNMLGGREPVLNIKL